MTTVCNLSVSVLALALCLSVVAQTKKTDRDIQGLAGKVQAVLEEGASLSGSPGDPSESMRYRSESSTYDLKGNQTERIIYGGPGGTETIERAYYSLDSEGNRIEKSYMGGSGIPSGSPPTLSQQDRAGDGAHLSRRVYKYDSQGNIVEEDVYRGGGALLYKDVYKYDAKGRRTEWQSFDNKGATESKITYSYSGDSQFPQTETREDGLKVKYTYALDSQGNWTKRVGLYEAKASDKTKQIGTVTFRSITYYDTYKANVGEAQTGETKTVWVIPAGFKDITNYEFISVPQTSATPPPGVTVRTGILKSGKSIKRVAPVHPPLAAQAKVVGRVGVEAIIDESGNVVWSRVWVRRGKRRNMSMSR